MSQNPIPQQNKDQGAFYATAVSAVKQLDLEKLRLLNQVVDSEIIKRKVKRAMKKGANR